MSEPIPESVPTSADPRSKRPLKRRALTPVSAQANQVEALFAKPDIDIPLPSTNGTISKRSTLAPPPEIVANVQGSSAGAGSGEFHVYKASRRREYERIKQMEEQVAREKADEDYERKIEEARRRDEEKTSKNKKRRKKMKARKGKKGGKGDVEMMSGQEDEGGDGEKKMKKLGPAKMPVGGSSGDEEEAVVKSVEDVGVVIHDDD
ncbi:MAG: hypothetical protein L6R42_004083 [Xanthoria sp. 1 TBL-2021]|nr:MAG: hypothetical protein L6R42_004083 [Xanthoria sp. 1 TBL-2021]